jgi:6-phosphogluconolactonase (cycloisomerase 2 family)
MRANRRRWVPARCLLAACLVLALAPASAVAERGLYISSFSSDRLSGFSVAADGVLTPLPDMPLETGDGPAGVAMTPDGRHLYVANRLGSRIEGFAVAPDGSLTPVPGSPFPVAAPDVLAVSSDGTRLYAGGALIDGLYGFQIAADGALTPISGSPFTDGRQSEAIALAPDGRHLFAVSHSTDEVASFAVGSDGALSAAGPPRAAGDEPVGVSIAPDGRHLYVASLGSNGILAFEVAADGSLAPVPGSPFDAEFGPQSTAVSPDGRWLYATSLFFGVFAYGIAPDGTLAPVLGSPFPLGGQPLGLTVNPSSGSLYVAGSNSGAVSALAVGTGGALAPIGAPVPIGGTGSGLQSLAITPAQGPVAALEAGAPAGHTVSFDAGRSSDPDGSIARYDWDFGDGSGLSTGTPTTSHAYLNPGTYTARVTVVDQDGCSTAVVFTGQTASCNGGPKATATRPVTIESAAPASSPAFAGKVSTAGKVTIKGRKLRLTRGGRATVRLACLPAEASGPCRGRLVLRTRGKVPFKGKMKRVVLARATFEAPAGATRAVRLKLDKWRAQLVRTNPRARKVMAIASVADRAGNRSGIAQRLTLAPAPSKRKR